MADFDAIVIGSGMSGGMAAKELCERGLKTLVLERGRDIDPAEDYTDMMDPWEYKHLDKVDPVEAAKHYAQQKDIYVFYESTKHLWVKDSEHPYETAPGTDYEWYRGYHTGGRSLLWARMSFRYSEYDFEANKRDGVGVDWPIRYADLAPWYDKVETFVGIAGERHDIPQIPAGQYQKPFDMNAGELWFKDKLKGNWPERDFIIAPAAHLTEPTEEQIALGRGSCQVRNKCFRGCSFGAYYSSVSASLPAARNTGNLTLQPNSIVHSIVFDPDTKRATGVRVIDSKTKETREYTAKVVFLNASTINSTVILQNSANEHAPNGLGNSSGELGRNLMDHVAGARVEGKIADASIADKYFYGNRPAVGYIPRYTNLDALDQPYKRSYAYQVYTERRGWTGDRPGVGSAFKAANQTPQGWTLTLDPYAEVLPDPKNRVLQHKTKVDRWGIPVPVLDARHGPNEQALLQAASDDAVDMMERIGITDIKVGEVKPLPPGNRIHEMGTARMGRDPKTSVLNEWNQCWDVPNIFVTDGACMTSAAVQNPSITYMAITARAANRAADLIEQGVL